MNSVRREIRFPQPPDQVWKVITDPATLTQWMFPNDFEPRIGHRFTFQVPPNPRFEGLTVRCEVLECTPPKRLAFSWSAGGPVENTQVVFDLIPDGDGTRLILNHTGFDLLQPHGPQAAKGAEYGWAKMLDKLSTILANPPADHDRSPR